MGFSFVWWCLTAATTLAFLPEWLKCLPLPEKWETQSKFTLDNFAEWMLQHLSLFSKGSLALSAVQKLQCALCATVLAACTWESAMTTFTVEKTLQVPDTFVAFSTLPGNFAWTHRHKGSYFMQEFIAVVRQYHTTHHLSAMLDMVNENTKKKVSADVSLGYEWSHNCHQAVHKETFDTKGELYLSPQVRYLSTTNACFALSKFRPTVTRLCRWWRWSSRAQIRWWFKIHWRVETLQKRRSWCVYRSQWRLLCGSVEKWPESFGCAHLCKWWPHWGWQVAERPTTRLRHYQDHLLTEVSLPRRIQTRCVSSTAKACWSERVWRDTMVSGGQGRNTGMVLSQNLRTGVQWVSMKENFWTVSSADPRKDWNDAYYKCMRCCKTWSRVCSVIDDWWHAEYRSPLFNSLLYRRSWVRTSHSHCFFFFIESLLLCCLLLENK